MATTKTKSKTKKKTRQRVWVALLLDESGSMGPLQGTVVEAVNGFVDDLRPEAKDKDMRVTLAMFDTRWDGQGNPDIFRVKVDGIPFDEAQSLTTKDYIPHGGTPLNDALLACIRHLDKQAKKRDKVMVVTMTDGEENSSEASTKSVRKAIDAKEKAGWAFIYLGANQDAWAEGGGRGIKKHSAMAFKSTPDGTRSAIKTTSSVASAYASASPQAYNAAMNRMAEATGGELAEDQAVDAREFLEDEDE